MANQTLQNLKNIHEMQKDGTILEFLHEIRDLKGNLEAFSKQIVDKKKTIKIQEEIAKKKAEEVKKVEEKPIVVPVVEEKKVASFSDGKNNNQNQFRKFDGQNNPNYKPREPFNRGDRPQYQNNNGQRPPYNRDGQRPQFNNQNRPNNFQRNGEQRPPFQNNGQRPAFNRDGQRPPFNKDGQRPNLPQRPGQKTNFVSTKANSFRSFEVPDTSIQFNQPERTFGNKNKSPDRNRVNEEKKSNLRKGGDFKKNTFISMGDNDFEETTMGSRKLKIQKKKSDIIIAPSVTHVILTAREISVKDLSEKTGKPVTELVKKLMLLGIMATINSSIDFDVAELVVADFGITLELKVDKTKEETLLDIAGDDDTTNMKNRPPVVAVMGHVDHGKTSLLDAFRKTNVVAGEAGGITQSIGAYQISFNGEKITFIDTPGHAAFTAMRARGAKATDIAILVVAADDGIMPQTVEAINHIKAAKVPMIVAINKMDKPEANPERIKQQLAEHDVLPEEWGGNAIIVPISAKTGMGMDNLKESILLVAEMEELKADPDRKATGVILEAELDKNKGPVATILVQNGTLKIGDSIMSGITYGKVKAMFDEHGKPLKQALPSTPVSVLGFNEVPSSGDNVYAVDETLSKQVIQERIDKIKQERASKTSGATLDNFMDLVHEGELKNLNIIIKADTQGSVEALKSTLLAIRNEEAKVNVIHSGAGAVTESDIILADTTGAVIISFNQKAVAKAKSLADSLKIQIKEYKIIYEVVDDITAALTGMLTTKYEEKYIGSGEIRVVFKLSSAGKVAGTYIKDGKATRGCIVKIKRGDEEIGTSIIDSLKVVKDEKAEVAKGFECGIKLKDNIDFLENDVIEFYTKEVVKRG